ncbi:MAG: hypothetical protein Q8L98_08295 [Chlamydiales bacterium]|nr:hypothetical protein [Chlamydiales bacterium]
MNRFFLLLLVFSASFLSAENKIIFLISTPRSLSVGFLRMMQARQDFEIFHEPTNAPYDAIHYKEFYEENFREDCFRSFDEITETIFEKAKDSNVFVKEVVFSFQEFLTSDHPLLEAADFVFLVRKPQDVILSFYRKGVPPSILHELVGHEQILKVFDFVTAHAKKSPYLLFSEDLGESPWEEIPLFCKHVGIPFKPESLSWEDLGSEFTGLQWRDGKKAEAVHYWHGDAIRSSCFAALKTEEVDEEGSPTFAEIENEEDRAICLKAYFSALPHYQALKEKWEALCTQNDLKGCL